MQQPEDTRVSKELTVGEVAARSGVAVSAIHFYESKGLIKAWRTSGNQRRYPREVLRRVAVIRVAQRVGMPLSAIREALLSLPANRTPTARATSARRGLISTSSTSHPGIREASHAARHPTVPTV